MNNIKNASYIVITLTFLTPTTIFCMTKHHFAIYCKYVIQYILQDSTCRIYSVIHCVNMLDFSI